MESSLVENDIRVYLRSECAVFKKTSDKWGGLSNMAPGYPLCVNGIPIRTAEALYQACRFPNDPEIQQKIIFQTSPMTAKMVGKPFRERTRPDWEKKRIVIMKWCLRVKLVQNLEMFSSLLKETRDFPIVEHSDKDAFWGAKPIDLNVLKGVNALGRLLMELRSVVVANSDLEFAAVAPPSIDNFILLGERIGQVSSSDTMPNICTQESFFAV